ncbi:MAG: methyltransferase domain-containing protein [Gammaproteobacteria bacterium]|nr:methyltransferase domain-containing protein [Gammaproteobacteria bacterium]
MPTPELAAVLACPRCELALQQFPDDSFHCGSCSLHFPELDGVPCLFAEPAATLAEWRQRLHFAREKLLQDAAGLKAELQNPRLRPLTRERLALLHEASVDQAHRLAQLLRPLALHQSEAGIATHLALQTRLPADQGLTTYYANIHRDWAWGDEENAQSLELVSRALLGSQQDDTPAPGTAVVLGSGAGRLAYDLHQLLPLEVTIALDFNPLLALLAARTVSGEGTELWEFPIAPRSIGDHAVLQTLVAPSPVRDGFHLILADVLRPPLRPESVDLVVTPWVVDILPENFQAFAARVNRLLKPGGRWVNFGSLAFSQPAAAARYSLEETLAIVMDSGFAEPAAWEDEIPYMCSPASRHGRRELVVTIAATKEQSVPGPARHRALPDWLVGGTQPVPLLPDFELQTMTTRIYAFIMGLIDGRRSVLDMARLIADQRLMTREEAEPAVRTFLTKMYEDSQRPKHF